MSKFIVLPCTIEDGPAIARNNMSAFWENPNWVLMWTKVGKIRDYVISQATQRFSHNLLGDPTHRRHLKAVDAKTGEIVGYVRYVLPEGSSADLWAEAKAPAVSKELAAEAKKNFDAADWNHDDSMDPLDEPMTAIKKSLMEGKGYLLLNYLAVHPSHQKQGIASLLVEAGAREADKMGFETFVLAFPAGLNVYKRNGFKLLDQLIQDDSKYGGPGEFAVYYLERKVGGQ